MAGLLPTAALLSALSSSQPVSLLSLEARLEGDPRTQWSSDSLTVQSPGFSVDAVVDLNLGADQWAVGFVQVCTSADTWATYETGTQHWVPPRSSPKQDVLSARNFEPTLDSADSFPWASKSSRQFLHPGSSGTLSLDFDDSPSTTCPVLASYAFLAQPEAVSRVGREQRWTVYLRAENVTTGETVTLAELVWGYDYAADVTSKDIRNPFQRKTNTLEVLYAEQGATVTKNGRALKSSELHKAPGKFPSEVLKKPSLNSSQELWWIPGSGTSGSGLRRALRIE